MLPFHFSFCTNAQTMQHARKASQGPVVVTMTPNILTHLFNKVLKKQKQANSNF